MLRATYAIGKILKSILCRLIIVQINSFFCECFASSTNKDKTCWALEFEVLSTLSTESISGIFYTLPSDRSLHVIWRRPLQHTSFFILEMNNHNFASLYQFLGERQNGVIDCLKLWFSTKLVKVLLSHNDFWNVRAQILLSSCLRVALYRSLESQRSVILLRSTRPLRVPCTWLQRFLGGLKSIEIGQNWQSYCAIDT